MDKKRDAVPLLDYESTGQCEIQDESDQSILGHVSFPDGSLVLALNVMLIIHTEKAILTIDIGFTRSLGLVRH